MRRATLDYWWCRETRCTRYRCQTEAEHKPNALEWQQLLDASSSSKYMRLPPSQIVLRTEGARLMHRSGRAQEPGKHTAPTSYRAKAANQLWSWSILSTPVRGQFY